MGQKPLFTPGDPEVESEGTKTPSKAFSDCSLLRPPSYYWSEFDGPPLMSLSHHGSPPYSGVTRIL